MKRSSGVWKSRFENRTAAYLEFQKDTDLKIKIPHTVA